MKVQSVPYDETLLLQTLYLHAGPIGYGVSEYNKLLDSGAAVEGLSTHQCRDILKRGARMKTGYLIDYYNGKPLKIEWNRISRHQILMSSVPFDSIHGRYRFLQALLNVFNPEEIWITHKYYEMAYKGQIKECADNMEEFKVLLKQMVWMDHPKRGGYWTFDCQSICYRSSFLDGLDG